MPAILSALVDLTAALCIVGGFLAVVAARADYQARKNVAKEFRS